MAGDIIVLVIIFLALGGFGLIKKLKEALEAQQEAGEDTRAEYEATPAEIQEFLRSITTGQRAQADVQAAAPAAPAPAPQQAEPVQVRQVQPQQAAQPRGAGRSFWDALEAPGRLAPVAAPEPQQTPRTRPRRRSRQRPAAKRPAPEQQAPGLAEAPAREKGKAAAGVTPLALKGMDLKQAVIWSEILGPPVSMRGRGRRR